MQRRNRKRRRAASGAAVIGVRAQAYGHISTRKPWIVATWIRTIWPVVGRPQSALNGCSREITDLPWIWTDQPERVAGSIESVLNATIA